MKDKDKVRKRGNKRNEYTRGRGKDGSKRARPFVKRRKSHMQYYRGESEKQEAQKKGSNEDEK